MKKTCKFCGKEFETKSKIRQCCSSHCSHKWGAIVTKERDKQFKRIYNVDDSFLKKEGAEKYYYLGLMASDGNISTSNNTISITQSGEDGMNIIKYIKKILNSDYKILSSQPPKGKTVYKLNIRSKELQEDLQKENIVPNKTHIYTIPEHILLDQGKLKNFLIGYIDGDGCIGVYKNMLTINFVCNPYMAQQLLTLDLFKEARTSNKGSVIDIRFNGIKAINFAKFLYKNISVYESHKYKKYKDYMDICLDIAPKMKYHILRNKILSELDKNPELNCMQYAKENNLNFQYVYKIKKGLE